MARAYSPPPTRFSVSHVRPIEGVLFWGQPVPLETRLLERNEQRERIEPLMRQSILARERYLRLPEHTASEDRNAALEVLHQADQTLMTAMSEDFVRQRSHDERIHELLSSINERLAYLEELEIARTVPLPECGEFDWFSPDDFMWRSRDQLPPVAPDISGLRPTPQTRLGAHRLRTHLEFLPYSQLDYAVRYNLEHLLRLHLSNDTSIPDFAMRKAMYAAFFAETYTAWYWDIREQRNMSQTHFRHFWQNCVSLLPTPERSRATRVLLQVPVDERRTRAPHHLMRAINTAFECTASEETVKEFAAQHIRASMCTLEKDYIPSVRNIYEYFRNFQLWTYYAYEHDAYRWSIFTGGLAESEIGRIFVDNIVPRTSRLAVTIQHAVTANPDMLTGNLNYVDKLFYVFRDTLQRDPTLRVHYDPPIPRALRPFAVPVNYSPTFPAAPRPGQPTSGDLFCLACFTQHIETVGRRTTRADILALCTTHDTEYCPRVIGEWDPMNPLCNPGPAVTAQEALATCTRLHFPRGI